MNEIKLQVGVKIFLKNGNGKFLIIKRNPEKYPNTKGSWDIVGGRINAGTKLLENLKREVQEETQLEIIGEPRLIFAQDIIPNPLKHVVRLTYIGSASARFGETEETNMEPVLDTEENIEYKWLSIDELKKQDDLDIYVKEIMDKGVI